MHRSVVVWVILGTKLNNSTTNNNVHANGSCSILSDTDSQDVAKSVGRWEVEGQTWNGNVWRWLVGGVGGGNWGEVGWDPSKCNAQLVQELLCSSTRRNNPEGKYICGYSWYTAYIFVNGSRGERGDGSIGGGGWPRGEKGKWEDYSVSESPTSSQLLYSIKIMTYRVMNFVVIIMVSLSDGLQTKTSIQPSIEKS